LLAVVVVVVAPEIQPQVVVVQAVELLHNLKFLLLHNHIL
jgi:hypothetical protein